MRATEYSRPDTSHCGPDGIYLNTNGAVNGDGPGGIFMLDPYGSACVVTSLKDLSSSIWVWHREGSNGASARRVCKAIEIPAEPGDPEKLPPQLRRFKAVSPLVTDINLSLDDRFLYVSRWGTGEFLQL
jgi:hypothetical protein